MPDNVSVINVYVINLDRSPERWEAICAVARAASVALHRVAGVDGNLVPLEKRQGFDARRFARLNGRDMLPGEYGCYRAHVAALEAFLGTSGAHAIIMEDDVIFPADILPRVAAILAAVPSADVVKLLNHRSLFFRQSAVTPHGDRIGRCLHGPQGSAAGYAVTREGARQLLQNGRSLDYPFDVMLEQGWRTGLSVYTVQENVVTLSARAHQSQIASREEYRSVKIRGFRKMTTHLVRLFEYARRVRYALSR